MRANVGDTIHYHSWRLGRQVKGEVSQIVEVAPGIDTFVIKIDANPMEFDYAECGDIKFIYGGEGDAGDDGPLQMPWSEMFRTDDDYDPEEWRDYEDSCEAVDDDDTLDPEPHSIDDPTYFSHKGEF